MKKRQTSSVTREIRNINRSFVSIARSFERLAPILASAASGTGTHGPARTASGRRRPNLSAAQMKALKLQGRYMGTMRGLSGRNQAKVKSIRKTRGIQAAIAAARKLSH
jgi:hypothetical protein